MVERMKLGLSSDPGKSDLIRGREVSLGGEAPSRSLERVRRGQGQAGGTPGSGRGSLVRWGALGHGSQSKTGGSTLKSA